MQGVDGIRHYGMFCRDQADSVDVPAQLNQLCCDIVR